MSRQSTGLVNYGLESWVGSDGYHLGKGQEMSKNIFCKPITIAVNFLFVNCLNINF